MAACSRSRSASSALFWHQLDGKGGKPGPELIGIHAAAGQGFLGNEVVQLARDKQAVSRNSIRHDALRL